MALPLYTIRPARYTAWSAALWAAWVVCWVSFTAESCVGGCYSTVTALFCLAGVTCDRSTVAEMTCDRSGVNAQHAHTQKESERMGGRGVWGWAVTVCVSLTFHLIGVHFDIVWCTLRHRVVYTSTSCVPRTWSSCPKAGAKCWSSIVKDCRV